MGSAQSTPTAAERAVVARLRALDLEEKQKKQQYRAGTNEDGFVEVDSSACPDEKTLDALRRSPTTLDVDQLEGWQTKLLEDPKNRCV